MTKEEKMEALGACGEKIVGNFLSSQGAKVEHFIDKFNSTGDFKISNTRGLYDGVIEVKTGTPFVTKNWFTVDVKQLKKIYNSDGVFFVCCACGIRDEYADMLFFMERPKETEGDWKTYKKEDKLMAGISRNHPNIRIIRALTLEESEELEKYSVSDYRPSRNSR